MGRGEIPLTEVFRLGDEATFEVVQNIVDLVARSDSESGIRELRAVMSDGGETFVGTGLARGGDRAKEAAQNALRDAVADERLIPDARSVLVNVAAGVDLTLFEVHDAVSVVSGAAGGQAEILWSTTIDESLGDAVRVTVIVCRGR